METLALEIVYHLAEQVEVDHHTGQRWPTILSCEKQHILSFRSVCRAFRDASWIQFRDVLAERIFYLNEEDLLVLNDIACHPRLRSLISTLTFGSQVFTADGLRILENGLADHPAHDQWLAGSGAWQRSLSAKSSLPYDELVQFKELYERSLIRQEQMWDNGDALAILSDCLSHLSQHSLRSIRIYPRPCHVTFEVKSDREKRLSFSSRDRSNHFHHGVNHTRCKAWRNIDRTLTALARLDGRLLQLRDLRTSSLSNIRWRMHSSIFKNTSLFSNLRTIQLSIHEDVLVDDYLYARSSSEEHAHQFVCCLMSAPNLTSLDLEMCGMGEDPFASYALSHLSEQNVPFRLQHLVLEYNIQSEEILTRLIEPHVQTLKRVLLLNSWVCSGTWRGWLKTMADAGLRADYLEIWKPCQGFGYNIKIHDVEENFSLRDMSKVAKEGEIICCIPQEQWDNCYPRGGKR